MTDHDHNCGHNHDPNPYTDPIRSAAYAQVIRHLFRLSAITCTLDARLTTLFSACTVVGLSDPNDRLPSFRALAWELGSLVNVMTGGKEPTMETHRCDDEGCEGHNDAQEAHFGEHAMRAFFAAASVGDLQEAVNVLDAVRFEATLTNVDEDAFVAQFFGNMMTSVAYTARANTEGTQGPIGLFGE